MAIKQAYLYYEDGSVEQVTRTVHDIHNDKIIDKVVQHFDYDKWGRLKVRWVNGQELLT